MEAATSENLVYDVSEADFQVRVLERSKTVPVVVDFWAEWCAPCRQLGPVIEQAVRARGGKVELAKLDTDANQSISRAFQIQGIPAVKAFKDGRVVDEFVGALPPAQVKQFFDGLVPSEADALVEAGDEASLRAALELEPDNEDAIVTLAELLVADERTEDALALLARIPETPDTRRVAALARTDVHVESDDITAKLDGLLDRVKDDDAARQEYVDLLELLGAEDPRTADYRRRLTTRLY
jgi:putative thioredoxin